MKKHTVPPEVIKAAENIYCCEPEYLGIVDGFEVYHEKPDDEDFPLPTGLPVILLWDGKDVRVVSGTESFVYLDPFYDN